MTNINKMYVSDAKQVEINDGEDSDEWTRIDNMSELGTRENPFELPQPQVDGPFEYPQQQINLSNNNTRDLDTCNVPVVELPQLVNLSVNDVSDLDTSNVLAEPTLLGNVFINKEEILTKDKSEINKGVCTSLGSGICQQIDVEFFDEAEQWRQLYITSQKQLEEANTKLSNIHCFYKNKNEQTKNEKLLDLKKIEQPLMARKKDFESNSIAMNGKDKALFKAKFKIDELERQLNNLEDRNNANIYELEADLAKLQKESQAEITELKDDLAKLQKESQAEITELKDDLAKLQKESQAKITELENKLGQSIFSNSSSNSSGESLIQAQTRITELEEENKTMTTNSNQITELQAQNTKLQSEKNSFERNVKALENTITTLQAAIENVTNEKSVSMQYLQTNLNELRMENEALKNSDLKNRAVLRGKDNLITKMLAGSSGQSINPNPCQQPKIAKVVTAEGLDLTDYQDIDKIKYITNTNLTESEVIKLYLDFGKNVNEIMMNNWFFGGSKKDPIPDKNNSDSDWEHYKNNKLATNTYNDTCSNGRIIPANISPEEPFQDLSKHDNTVVGNVAKYVESLSDSDDDEILKHQTDVKVHCSNASNVQKYDPNANSSDDEILLDKKNTEPNYEKLYRIEVDERKHYANEIMEKDKKIAELNQVVEEKVQKTSILRNELSSARDLNTELFNDVKKLEFEIENWKQSSINKHNEALSNLEKIKVNENVYREEAEVAKMNAVKNLKIFEDKNRQQRDAMQRNFDELNNEYSKVVNNHKDLQREYAYMDNNHREQYQNESRTNMKISRQLKEANDKIETHERQIAQMTKRVTELELIVEKQSEDARLATVRGNGLRDMISLKDILDGKIDSNSSSDEDEDLVLDRKIDSNSPAKYTEEKVNDSPAKYVEEKVNDSPAKYVEKDQMESDDKDIEEDLLEKIYILLNSKYTKEEILREFNLCNKNIGVTFQTLKNRSTNSN